MVSSALYFHPENITFLAIFKVNSFQVHNLSEQRTYIYDEIFPSIFSMYLLQVRHFRLVCIVTNIVF